jgi:hypothetical protein
MPTIGYIGSIQIRIYYDDHGVPHFHASVQISISRSRSTIVLLFPAPAAFAAVISR